VKIVINSAEAAVAVIHHWTGPVPRQGDYVKVPGSGPSDAFPPAKDLRAVLYVVWHVLAPHPGQSGIYDVSTEPFAEVMVA
jgi:hypothetical protein